MNNWFELYAVGYSEDGVDTYVHTFVKKFNRESKAREYIRSIEHFTDLFSEEFINENMNEVAYVELVLDKCRAIDAASNIIDEESIVKILKKE